jgi:hypothetical protein
MWQGLANNIPKLTRKGYQPLIRFSKLGWLKSESVWALFGEHIVWIPQLVDIACGSLRKVLYGAFGTKFIGHIVCPAFVAI